MSGRPAGTRRGLRVHTRIFPRLGGVARAVAVFSRARSIITIFGAGALLAAYRIRGASSYVFVSPPDHAHFYSELLVRARRRGHGRGADGALPTHASTRGARAGPGRRAGARARFGGDRARVGGDRARGRRREDAFFIFGCVRARSRGGGRRVLIKRWGEDARSARSGADAGAPTSAVRTSATVAVGVVGGGARVGGPR